MWSSSARVGFAFISVAALVFGVPGPASAQDRGVTVLGDAGFASIGHADSEQGKAPIAGGGVTWQLTRHLAIEGDVHGARVRHVFGREHHDFTEVTVTGSALFRAPVEGRAHVVTGVGLGLQRAHVRFELPSTGTVDRTEAIRLVHGRIGAEWDVSDRVVIRTAAVLWLAGGLDWVLGGRVGVGYRF